MTETVADLIARRRDLAQRREALMAEHITPLDEQAEALAEQIKEMRAAAVADITEQDLRTDPTAIDRLALACVHGAPGAYTRLADFYESVCPGTSVGLGSYRYGEGEDAGVIMRPKVLDHFVARTGVEAYLTALTALANMITWREEDGKPTRVAFFDVSVRYGNDGIHYIEADLDTNVWTYRNAYYRHETDLVTGAPHKVLTYIAKQYLHARDLA